MNGVSLARLPVSAKVFCSLFFLGIGLGNAAAFVQAATAVGLSSTEIRSSLAPDMPMTHLGHGEADAEKEIRLEDVAAAAKVWIRTPLLIQTSHTHLFGQTLIAGLGNIYVSEALWRAGLSPRRLAGSIVSASGKGARTEKLAEAIRAVIADAIAAGGSSLRDYVHADGSLGYFQHSFSVYDREGEPCRRPGCKGTIARIVQSGRSTFYCPACQR